MARTGYGDFSLSCFPFQTSLLFLHISCVSENAACFRPWVHWPAGCLTLSSATLFPGVAFSAKWLLQMRKMRTIKVKAVKDLSIRVLPWLLVSGKKGPSCPARGVNWGVKSFCLALFLYMISCLAPMMLSELPAFLPQQPPWTVLKLSAASWRSVWPQSLHSPKLQSSRSALGPTQPLDCHYHTPEWQLPPQKRMAWQCWLLIWFTPGNPNDCWHHTSIHTQCDSPWTKAVTADAPVHRHSGTSVTHSQTTLMKWQGLKDMECFLPTWADRIWPFSATFPLPAKPMSRSYQDWRSCIQPFSKYCWVPCTVLGPEIELLTKHADRKEGNGK